MENAARFTLEQVRSTGVPVAGLPEARPSRDGFALAALVTNDDKRQFVVDVSDDISYGSYRNMTKHRGDQGNWFFKKMELFFVPLEQPQAVPQK